MTNDRVVELGATSEVQSRRVIGCMLRFTYNKKMATRVEVTRGVVWFRSVHGRYVRHSTRECQRAAEQEIWSFNEGSLSLWFFHVCYIFDFY